MSVPPPIAPSPCDHFERAAIDNYVDAETQKEIGSNFRTLPTFEKTLFELKFMKMYSMENNKRLACRWAQFINKDSFKHATFQFPSWRDLHFQLNTVRHMPSLSMFRKTDYRMKLTAGPGVDMRGQMPIPFELHMKRGISSKEQGSHKKADKKTKKPGDKTAKGKAKPKK